MPFGVKNLKNLIQIALEHKASDVHIRTNEEPCFRIHGRLIPVQSKDFSLNDLKDISDILTDRKFNSDTMTEYDGAYEIKDLCRLRYNIFRYNSQLGIILRIVNMKIPTIDQLGLSPSISKIAEQKRGLILVTGTTGSGKSTTLAAMIDHINKVRSAHIITVEDPVEYMHTSIKSRISQREVGTDTPSFADALRAALRQDPDIILIGEMRDPETVSIALKAAETGHLVFSTLHTTNAVTTIGRILALFPPEEQPEVSKRLAENLYSTIGQRLLRNKKKDGFVVAQEIMVTTPGIKECILGDEPLSRIFSIIGQAHGPGGNGSQGFDQHVMELYQNKKISKNVALGAVNSQSDFIQKLLVD